MEKISILTQDEVSYLDNNMYQTPFIIYDQQGIEENTKRFYKAFDRAINFQNYFAIKACPNPTILNILTKIWHWADCSSMWELVMSEICGIKWENIMFTSNNTSSVEFIKAHSLWAIINFDDITHIPFYKQEVWKMPKIACCRFNPWALKKWNNIIWKPKNAKYWMTKTQIFDAYKMLKNQWVKRFWLHTMVASNELNPYYFIETAKILFELARKLEQELSISFEFINLWWWIGIPYSPAQEAIDFQKISDWIYHIYKDFIWTRNKTIKIAMECGRVITWPYWQLVTKVQHVTEKYKKYVWVDASMQCLMRPALYWAYHHVTVLGKEYKLHNQIYDITWSLCENNDKFAIDRSLPTIKKWNYLVIHDAWAHGIAMWFNYNAKLRPAELLKTRTWVIKLIRRAETLEDYFATIHWIDGFQM